jgi:CRP-like cAMP-binding protein
MASSELQGREFGAGDVLFREGEPGEVMYVIEQGSVRLTKDIDGEPTTLAELTPGDFVGELAIVGGGSHTTTAVATSATRCLSIRSDALESMVTSNKEIAVRFIKGLASRLVASHEMLATVGQRDARTRVVMAILRYVEASTDKRPDGVWISRRLGDIGEEVAISKNELGEISKQFLKLQLLRIKRDGILVPDPTRLYDFMKSGDV